MSEKELPLIEKYRNRQNAKERWQKEYKELVDIWGDFLLRNQQDPLNKAFSNLNGREESFLQSTPTYRDCFEKFEETEDKGQDWHWVQREKEEHSKGKPWEMYEYLGKMKTMARRLALQDGCAAWPFEIRKKFLADVQLRPELHFQWPMQDKWEIPDKKVRPYEWDTRMGALTEALLAFAKGNLEDTQSWLDPRTSDLVQYVAGKCGMDSESSLLSARKDEFAKCENKEKILEALSKVLRYLQAEKERTEKVFFLH